jgi:hypothetical protein
MINYINLPYLIKSINFFVVLSLLFVSSAVFAYDSNKVGKAAGKYYGIAVSVDYFFDRSSCKNTMFGMRKINQKMTTFVYNDIYRSLSTKDKSGFVRVKNPQFIQTIIKGGGEALMNMHSRNLSRNRQNACLMTESMAFGMLTSALSEWAIALGS